MAMTQVERKSLADWRATRGMDSREQLAAATGSLISVATIGRIERGAVVPNRATRHALATALGVGVDQIIWPTGAPSED
jgi:transcriptional regulator with XRE-family HTH domain